MKSKIAKIMGVVLAVATVASLFVMAVPAAAVYAPTAQTWSNYAIPSTTGMVLADLTTGGPIAQAFDGSALYAAVTDNSSPVANFIIKSVDNGRTWKKSGTVGQPGVAAVVELVCSPTEANVVFYITATSLYMSVDSGVTFSVKISVSGADALTSFDVAKWGTPARYIAVVGTNAGSPATAAGVYYWDESLPFNNLTQVGSTAFDSWATTATAILNVRMAATFAIDRTVVAVGIDPTAHTTKIRMDVNGGAWGATVLDVAAFGTGADATAADIAFPSDFNVVTSPIYFVSVADSNDGNIFRVIGDTKAAVGPTTPVRNVTNMSSSGSFASNTGTILAGTSVGTTYKSSTSGNTFGGTAVALRSSVATTAWVLLDRNYGTSKMAWILNVGAVNGALNVTTDGSVYNQWSLINETIKAAAGIIDFAVASNGDLFMITTNAAATDTSLWRNLVASGTPWERVLFAANTTTADHIRLGLDYATNKTLATWNNTTPAAAIPVSKDSANSFTAMSTAPGTIVLTANHVTALLLLNGTTVVVGDATGTIVTNNGAYWWVETTNAPFGVSYTVNSIVSAGGSTLLAAAVNGTSVEVAKSTDNGVTWALLPAIGTYTDSILTVTAGPAFVQPAADFATSGRIIVASGTGVFSYPSTATGNVNGWKRLDAAAGSDAVTTATGLVTAPGGPGSTTEGLGMIYATDSNTTNFDVARIRGLELTSEKLVSVPATGPAGADTFTGLWAYPATVAGNIQLWTLDSTVTGIWTYNDTLGKQGTGVVVSNVATAQTPFFWAIYTSTATVTFDNLANATGYAVFVNPTRVTSLYGAADGGGAVPGAIVTGATTSTCNITGMTPGTVYFVSVWATGPVSSFMFAGASTINTPLTVPVTPTNLVPVLGATNVPVLPNFAWASVSGATGYSLQVTAAADTAFANPIFSNLVVPAVTGPTVTWNYVVSATSPILATNTSYIWRVKANGVDPSAWVLGNFTTIPAVIPPVTVTNPPAITLTATNPPAVTLTATNPPAITLTCLLYTSDAADE